MAEMGETSRKEVAAAATKREGRKDEPEKRARANNRFSEKTYGDRRMASTTTNQHVDKCQQHQQQQQQKQQYRKWKRAKEMVEDEKEKCFIRCAWSADVSFNFNEFSIRFAVPVLVMAATVPMRMNLILFFAFFFSPCVHVVLTLFEAAIPHRSHERVHFNLCFSNVVNSSGIKTDENILTQKFN